MSVRTAFRGGYQNRPGWWLNFDYDQNLIDGLKSWVPAGDRSWDPERRLWWIAIEHEEKLVAYLPGFKAYTKQGQLL